MALLAGIASGGLGSLIWIGVKRSGAKKKSRKTAQNPFRAALQAIRFTYL
jgi:hypothetical protein